MNKVGRPKLDPNSDGRVCVCLSLPSKEWADAWLKIGGSKKTRERLQDEILEEIGRNRNPFGDLLK